MANLIGAIRFGHYLACGLGNRKTQPSASLRRWAASPLVPGLWSQPVPEIQLCPDSGFQEQPPAHPRNTKFRFLC